MVRDRRARAARTAHRQAHPRRRRRHRLRPARRPPGRCDRDRRQRRRRHHGADLDAQAGPADRARAAPRVPVGPALRRRRRPDAGRVRLAVLRAPAGLHDVPQTPARCAGDPARRRRARPQLRRLGPARVDGALRGDAPQRVAGAVRAVRRRARDRREDQRRGARRPGRGDRGGQRAPRRRDRGGRVRRDRRVPVLPALARRRSGPLGCSARSCQERLGRRRPARQPLGLRHARRVRLPGRRVVGAAVGGRLGRLRAVRAGPHRRQAGRPRRQPADRAGGSPGPGGAGQGARVRRPVRHVRTSARVPARRARPDDRHRGRAQRHPARLRGARLAHLRGDRAEGRGGVAQGLRRRALRDGRAADGAGLPVRVAVRGVGVHGARRRACAR